MRIILLNSFELIASTSYCQYILYGNVIATHSHLVVKLAKWLNCVVSTYLYVAFYIMSCKSFRVNPHSIVCLNVKELLAWSRCHIWSLSDSNVIRIHNHFVHKQTLNHLAKLVKWLGCVLSTYLYRAFDCMLLLGHVWVSEWIHTL